MPDGWTPIALAARYGHVKIVKLIPPLVENPNEPINQNGLKIYPICLAVKNGKKGIEIETFLAALYIRRNRKEFFMLFYAIVSVYKLCSQCFIPTPSPSVSCKSTLMLLAKDVPLGG